MNVRPYKTFRFCGLLPRLMALGQLRTPLRYGPDAPEYSRIRYRATDGSVGPASTPVEVQHD